MSKWYQNITVPVLSICGISLNLSDILTVISIINIIIVIGLNIYDRIHDKNKTKKQKIDETIQDLIDGAETIEEILDDKEEDKNA